jgi:hypothetical protein
MEIVFITLINKEPDERGNQRFFCQWKTNNIGISCNEVGLRGQIYFGNLTRHIDIWKEGGYKIEFINSLKH